MNILIERNVISDDIYKLLKEKYQTDDFEAYMLSCFGKKDDDYKRALDMFKYIFSLGEKGRIFLWNELFHYDKFDRSDYSKEELEFLDELNRIRNKFDNNSNFYDKNINSAIYTERLKLCPFDEKLDKEYIGFLLNNPKEYESYYMKEFNPYEINRFSSQLGRKLSFAILDKKTDEFYGVIALDLLRSESVYNIEYIIFPDYRKNGYAKEALQALINKAVNNELIVLNETIRKGIFVEEKPKIKCIEANIKTFNEASQKLVDSLGFVLNGFVPLSNKLKDKFYDSKIYDLIINNE